MNPDICMNKQTQPLPGLTKLYLLQLYPLALALLCARFALTAVGIEGGAEPVLWAITFFAFGITSIAVIAGIHSRAGWPPTARHASTSGCVFFAWRGWCAFLRS